MNCPKCGSDAITIDAVTYDNGMDMETGYHDFGCEMSMTCHNCGFYTDDVEGDLVFEPVLLATEDQAA